MKLYKSIFIILTMILLVGCSTDWKAKVESDTAWSGAFGNRTVAGVGSKVIDLPDDDVTCCVVQKQTKEGYLKVSVVNEGNSTAPNGESASTIAEYGVVIVCSQ